MTIYYGSVIASWLATSLIALVAAKKMDDEGYRSVHRKKPVLQKVIEYAAILLYNVTPVLNIILPIYAIFNFDKMYEKVCNSLVKEGKLIKKEEKKSESETSENSNTKEEKVLAKKECNELSNNEKNEVLEEGIINPINESVCLKEEVSKSYNDKGAYTKKR